MMIMSVARARQSVILSGIFYGCCYISRCSDVFPVFWCVPCVLVCSLCCCVLVCSLCCCVLVCSLCCCVFPVLLCSGVFPAVFWCVLVTKTHHQNTTEHTRTQRTQQNTGNTTEHREHSEQTNYK